MKLYWQILKLLFRKVILRQNTGIVVKDFAEAMGVVYIKLAQILATQNFGSLFTEKDRQVLAEICDKCQVMDFEQIKRILAKSYGDDFEKTFSYIEAMPLGSASIAQVHKAKLTSGEEVVLKIRRPNVTLMIDEEIKRIRKLMHRFGGLIKFKNYAGGDQALNLYLKWIKQEADFEQECKNLQLYHDYIEKMTRKMKNSRRIKVPKVFKEFCSKDIIVMEYVPAKTLNQLELNSENREKVCAVLNDYLKLSFEGMLDGGMVAFHGDPHPGNLCVGVDGTLWFLDLGMLCVLEAEETKWCRKFFLAIYTKNVEKVVRLLLEYGKLEGMEAMLFREECRAYCENVRDKEITSYFVDMMGICLKYELVPPDFLFSLVKAFLCLNGINGFMGNKLSAPKLLQTQTMKFMMRRTVEDFVNLAGSAISLLPVGLAASEDDFMEVSGKMKEKVKFSVKHFREVLKIVEVGLEG